MPTDAVKADPKHYKVELENDKVRVIRIRYGPHEKSPMHSHPDGIGIFLTEHHSKHPEPSGASREVRAKAGDVLWFPAITHAPENLSSQPMELIFIELKG